MTSSKAEHRTALVALGLVVFVIGLMVFAGGFVAGANWQDGIVDDNYFVTPATAAPPTVASIQP